MRYAVFCLMLAPCDCLAAQALYPPERSGLIGSVAVGRAALSLDSSPFESKQMLSARFGLRINPLWCTRIEAFRITPHFAYATTDRKGMNPKTDKFALADIEGGVEASVRIRRFLRPYAFYRAGSHTAERIDNLQTWNYSGHGISKGVGLEIPLLAGGSGVDLGLRFGSGRLTDAERLGEHRAIDMQFRERIWYVGWSGSLQGM